MGVEPQVDDVADAESVDIGSVGWPDVVIRSSRRRQLSSGAPTGNTNALKHGRYTAEAIARHVRKAPIARGLSFLSACPSGNFTSRRAKVVITDDG
jgi:hypothetical protein